MTLKTETHPVPSMIQLKHVVADSIGLPLVVACPTQKTVSQDHLPYFPISSLQTTLVVVACKTVSLGRLVVRWFHLRWLSTTASTPAVLLAWGGLTIDTARHVALEITPMVGLLIS